VQAALERDQLAAQQAANASRVTEITRQVEVIEAQKASTQAERAAAMAQRAALQAQLDTARTTRDRIVRLFAQQAATSQQRDQAERDVRVLEEQVKAQDGQIEARSRQMAAQDAQVAVTRAQRDTAARQVQSAAAQVARAEDRVGRAAVRNPSAGTVLVTYVRTGEVVAQGQPLYRIANLDEVDVRAYVTATQLAALRIGGLVRVTFDAGIGRETTPGAITWISDRSEFTPTPIQTREERADLVYAIKIRVPNRDGKLKIGMPVDVQLSQVPAQTGAAGEQAQ
jgi:HlyD family secretion protein